MAKVVCKGTKFQQDLASTLTTIAQVTSISHSGAQVETVESDTLDSVGAGIKKTVTGRTEPGSMSADLIFDPALAGHQNVMDILTTPVDETWNIEFSDTKDLGFTGAPGLDIDVQQGDVVRGSINVDLTDLATYPT